MRRLSLINIIFLIFGKCSSKPNILIIIADDLGIGDIGCFGNDSIKTPNIDRLAETGVKLTHHLTVATYCSPSRAALLTSRYPVRYGFVGGRNGGSVIGHLATRAHLPYDELTLAEVLQEFNYSTGIVGKWHLGSHCSAFGISCKGPLNHGFSKFYGLPMSPPDNKTCCFWSFDLNDRFYQMFLAFVIASFMPVAFVLTKKRWIIAVLLLLLIIIINFVLWFTYTHLRLYDRSWNWASDWFHFNMNKVLIKDGKVIDVNYEFGNNLSQRLINQSVEFIKASEKPFFHIHSFIHPHFPMFTSKENKGRSVHGEYGDNVEEMDEGVGILLDTIKQCKIENDTIVYFLSDHGGHIELINADGNRIGGYNGKYKGGKGTGGQEGGIRVPGIIRWTGKISPGVLDFPTSTLDIMPTLLDLVDISSPALMEKELDGVSFMKDLLGKREKLEMNSRIFLHYCRNTIHSIRWMKGNKIYKMHIVWHKWTHGQQCGWGVAFCSCYDVIDYWDNPLLFELNSDPYEDTPIKNTTEEYITTVKYLKSYINEWRNKSFPDEIFTDWKKNMWLPWLQPIFASEE